MKKRKLNTLLKNKNRFYSAEAALTSFIFHLLLIVFAGSIVAVRYVQKQNAELIARTESHPKLERKKLQAPARVEQLQKRALTSKLVSKKVSVSNPEFVFPDTGKIGSLKTQKISLPGVNVGRALSNLSRASGIGPSRIDFFGVRAEGEKVVLIIDASAVMLDDRTGGSATYAYIKSELAKIVSEMKPVMLFNLIFYDQQRVYMFRPNLVPAARETAAEMVQWMQSVNRDPAQPGLLPDQSNYQAPVLYQTAIGSDAQGWLLALQAAMEQQPDNVMILGSGWSHHHISPDKAARLLDYAMWELLVGNVISGAPALMSDRKLRDDMLKEAGAAIQQEEKLRTAKAVPAGFVRDVAQYVEYSKNQVLEHLDTVCKASYNAHGLSAPNVHYVCLTEADSKVITGGTIRHLWALTGRYAGKLEFLRRGPGIVPAENADSSVNQTADSSAVVSPANFFGMQETGSRIAFVLDASPAMLADESGGTFSYNFIKDRIQKGVEGLSTGVQFNVILCSGKQMALFKPQMVFATPENTAALKDWLQPVNSDLSKPGIPENLVSGFAVKDYGTVVGTDSSGWLRALQAAMEQQADRVFIAGFGWGDHLMSREKGRKLLDFSVWNAWGGGEASGSGTGGGSAGGSEEGEDGEIIGASDAGSSTATASAGGASLGIISGMQQDKKQRDTLLKEALKAIAKEDRIRKAAGNPQPFVRDVLLYLNYTAPQINDHLNAVVQAEYISRNAAKPAINFICLVPADGSGGLETTRNLRKLTGDYKGDLILFRGAGSSDELKELNKGLELTDW